MKKPFIFALCISLLATFTMLSATALKLASLGKADFADTISVFGVPITYIEQNSEGFSVEMLPGIMVISAVLGAVVFALLTAQLHWGGAKRY